MSRNRFSAILPVVITAPKWQLALLLLESADKSIFTVPGALKYCFVGKMSGINITNIPA